MHMFWRSIVCELYNMQGMLSFLHLWPTNKDSLTYLEQKNGGREIGSVHCYLNLLTFCHSHTVLFLKKRTMWVCLKKSSLIELNYQYLYFIHIQFFIHITAKMIQATLSISQFNFKGNGLICNKGLCKVEKLVLLKCFLDYHMSWICQFSTPFYPNNFSDYWLTSWYDDIVIPLVPSLRFILSVMWLMFL